MKKIRENKKTMQPFSYIKNPIVGEGIFILLHQKEY
jgi:hypothetical protein